MAMRRTTHWRARLRSSYANMTRAIRGREMAVVNIHSRLVQDQREVTLQPTRFFGTSDPASLKFWLIGIIFLALYSVLNKVTVNHQLDGLGITLWSPYNGLSLLLLTEGIIFAPFVLLGAVLTDIFILRVDHSLYVTVAVELVLTVCYVGLAAILRHKLKFNPRRARLSNVVVLLIVVPVCTVLTSLLYCGVLYLGGALPADKFLMAMRHFWIGDTVGIIAIFSLATSVFAFLSKPGWHWSWYTFVSCSVFILGTCLGFAMLLGGRRQTVPYILSTVSADHLGGNPGRLRRSRGCAVCNPTGTCRSNHLHGVR